TCGASTSRRSRPTRTRISPRPATTSTPRRRRTRTPASSGTTAGRRRRAEREGFLHCLDARTGQPYWEYDLKDSTWCSPYYADGKVYLGTEGGDLFVF